MNHTALIVILFYDFALRKMAHKTQNPRFETMKKLVARSIPLKVSYQYEFDKQMNPQNNNITDGAMMLGHKTL